MPEPSPAGSTGDQALVEEESVPGTRPHRIKMRSLEQSINPETQELKSTKAVITYADILVISGGDCDTTMVTSVH